ncbi:MAG TPA: EAL domain-containing protein [Steroidobacteraceae bacterium]|jgi:diguanylate cyclase (GGDEF)-like protein
MDYSRIRSFVIRHRITIRGLSLIMVAGLLGLYFAYKVDIFPNEGGVAAHENAVEIDEMLLLGALVTLALLMFGIQQYLAQKREMAKRIDAERRVRELAYEDGLTGLPNRRQFDEALKAALAAPPRADAAHGIFLLDLNGFKKVNDVHGHAVGDEVLIIVGQRLRMAMREGSIVARFGGDEFAILASHLAGPEAATSLALRVIDALATPVAAGGSVHHLGVGIGIALVPTDAATIDEALRKADIALYRAKSERRSALRFYESAMDVRVQERAAMERALHEAIEKGRIETMYQPTVDLRTRKIIGFEAVPYWVDPQQGAVARERFIEIAEEAGLIHGLAEGVLRQACEAAQAWPDYVQLSIDIYPTQLKDRSLPQRILQILEQTGLPPARLEMEITESALVADMENAQQVLGALRTAGVRIALDNFGTGYSSLYHLRNFKLDKIKIDRSFIQAMGSERASAGIVNALVGLGHGLELTIAADGVEGADQEASLVRSGCEQGQGQFFSAPIRATEIAGLFGSEATASLRLLARI